MSHLSRLLSLVLIAIAVCAIGVGVPGKFVTGQEFAKRKSAAPVSPGHWKATPKKNSIFNSTTSSLTRIRQALSSDETEQVSQGSKKRTVRHETWNPLKGVFPIRRNPNSKPAPNVVTHADQQQVWSAPIRMSESADAISADSNRSSDSPNIILAQGTSQDSARVTLAQFELPENLLKLLPKPRTKANKKEEAGTTAQPNKVQEGGQPVPKAPTPKAPTSIPQGGGQFRIPINDLPNQVVISGNGDELSLQVSKAPISEVLALISQQHNLNIVTGVDVDGLISVNLSRVKLEDALHAILTVNGYTWIKQKNILVVSKVDEKSKVSAMVQGRQVRVFSLNYVSGVDIDLVVKGLLSPVGQSFVTQATTGDKRKTREQIAVEDLPEYIDRISAYIKQVDIPPRQVLIEAHVMRIDLSESTRHGVNFETLLQMADTDVTLRTQGFASAASSPAFFLGIDGADLDALIEAIKTTTSAKTLASPKVLAVNGQESKIQIGERLGYLVTTTTQTSTLQNVNFLETGVVLTVTPTIAANGKILMSVMPKISAGRVNPDSGLPEEETTDVTSTVLLNSGQAMVIGGLITEQDVNVQSKIPIAGDLWLVGRLFQKRSVVRERTEIVIALIPRLVPFDSDYQDVEHSNVYRATSPLLTGTLKPIDRQAFEPELSDATKHPRSIRLNRILNAVHDLECMYPRPLEYYFPSTTDPWYNNLDQ
jgi:type IV pilus assembly protein PilQ